ncbi:MAG TPA: hypothetical protein DIW47_13720 [Bacteroidetes bacterium]|nr:hypothetical protein [Bacteroidota bacterium]
MKTITLILLFSGCYDSASQAPVEEKHPPLSFGVGLNLGVIPGIDAGLQVSRFVGTRLKAGYFRYNDYPYDVYVQSVKLETRSSLKLGAVEILGDVFPFGSGLFRVTGGLAIFTRNTLHIRGYLGETIYYEGQEIRPEDVGFIDADISWKRAGAYLGIGMGRTVPKNRVGAGFDLGVYYMGKPSVDVNYTEEYTPEIRQALQEYVEPYKFLPYLNVRVSFRLIP